MALYKYVLSRTVSIIVIIWYYELFFMYIFKALIIKVSAYRLSPIMHIIANIYNNAIGNAIDCISIKYTSFLFYKY